MGKKQSSAEHDLVKAIFHIAKTYYTDRFPHKESILNRVELVIGHSAPFNNSGQEWPDCPTKIIKNIKLLSLSEFRATEIKKYVMGRISKDKNDGSIRLIFHPLLPGFDVDLECKNVKMTEGCPTVWIFKSRISLYYQIIFHELGHIVLRNEPIGEQPNSAEIEINSWIVKEFVPDFAKRSEAIFIFPRISV